MFTPDKFQREIKGNNGIFTCSICGKATILYNNELRVGCMHVDFLLNEDTLVIAAKGFAS